MKTISLPAPSATIGGKVQILKAVARYRKVINQNFDTLFRVQMVACAMAAVGSFLELPLLYKPAIIVAAIALFSWYISFVIDGRKERQL